MCDEYSKQKVVLFFRCPINAIVHRHKIDMRSFFLHQILDLVEKLLCGVPWENLPLEHIRFNIKIVPFKVFWS